MAVGTLSLLDILKEIMTQTIVVGNFYIALLGNYHIGATIIKKLKKIKV